MHFFGKPALNVSQGAYGEVRKAIHKASNITRAVKIIARRHADSDQEEVIMNEVGILRELVHFFLSKLDYLPFNRIILI